MSCLYRVPFKHHMDYVQLFMPLCPGIGFRVPVMEFQLRQFQLTGVSLLIERDVIFRLSPGFQIRECLIHDNPPEIGEKLVPGRAAKILQAASQQF